MKLWWWSGEKRIEVGRWVLMVWLGRRTPEFQAQQKRVAEEDGPPVRVKVTEAREVYPWRMGLQDDPGPGEFKR